MATLTGFLDFERNDFLYKGIKDRLGNYEEFLIMRDDREIKRQSARCMGCKTPFCHGIGCPIFNRIPEWLDLVLRKDMEHAYKSLVLTNNFPEFTGRICPALCEKACSLSIDLSPVTIKQIELYIIEKAFERGYIKPEPPTERNGKRAAVVGSGPTGLSAALTLNRKGYKVTVYEKYGEIGGLMRRGIPNFKLPKRILDRRIDLMEKEGIVFETNVSVGADLSIHNLKENFDAALLSVGAGTPRNLSVPGRESEGVCFALDYLTQSNEFVSGKKKESEIIHAGGKNVIVIGGGDTGSDCVGTANRQRAKNVTQIEILPKPAVWEKSNNPSWPDYPNILRTSSSHEEGCVRYFSVSAKRFLTKNKRLTGVACVRVEWTKDSANTGIMREIPGSEFVIEADLAILSMGFLHTEHSQWLREIGIAYDKAGNINIQGYCTNINGLFAAGDAATGVSLVCRGIYCGKQAAEAMDAFLR
ncbi:MAG: glutamate synthase subunit beta [Clostridiales Family XIII bacterium]|jgi:glutamate synthase (NADPH/NADH) small chain|nr:glutamate synthase subunit beta [Clostridiales Family XIII bacterium]